MIDSTNNNFYTEAVIQERFLENHFIVTKFLESMYQLWPRVIRRNNNSRFDEFPLKMPYIKGPLNCIIAELKSQMTSKFSTAQMQATLLLLINKKISYAESVEDHIKWVLVDLLFLKSEPLLIQTNCWCCTSKKLIWCGYYSAKKDLFLSYS